MRELSVVTGIIILMLVLITGCTGGPGYGQPTPTPSVTEPVTPTFSPTSTPPSTAPITTFPTLPAVVPENISINWAGYVVQTSFDVPEKNAIESVEAVWNVPSVDCSQTGMSDYSSAFWVGIDGFSSVSVEQIGTDSDCIQGSPVYYGWYELYPKDSVTLDLTIRPGDDVHAKVDYLGNNEFRFSLTDITTNQSISIIDMSTIAERSSAEWISEAPVYRRRILPLSDFGPVDFINASVTIKGHTGSIFSDQWDYRSIVMEATDGTIKATPTGLVNGNSFSIVWEHQ